MKRVPHPLEQAPEKIDLFTPSSVTRTVLAAPKNITSKYDINITKSFMDAKVARKRAEKKANLRNN